MRVCFLRFLTQALLIWRSVGRYIRASLCWTHDRVEVCSGCEINCNYKNKYFAAIQCLSLSKIWNSYLKKVTWKSKVSVLIFRLKNIQSAQIKKFKFTFIFLIFNQLLVLWQKSCCIIFLIYLFLILIKTIHKHKRSHSFIPSDLECCKLGG